MKRLTRTMLVLSLGVLSLAAAVSPREASAASLSQNQYFTLKDLNGKETKLDALLQGKKAVLVNFWATWCPPCREEIPDLIRLQEKYKDRGFTVIGVDVGESVRKVSKFAEQNGMNYPLVLDKARSVTETYKIVGIPTSLLIASDGTILGEYHSAEAPLFEAVEKALR
jgi:thiol-disulfide isomerase/thioredoxin